MIARPTVDRRVRPWVFARVSPGNGVSPWLPWLRGFGLGRWHMTALWVRLVLDVRAATATTTTSPLVSSRRPTEPTEPTEPTSKEPLPGEMATPNPRPIPREPTS